MSEKEKALNTISNIDEWAETGEPAGKGLHLSRICAVFAAVALAAACGLGLSALLAGDMAGWIYAGIAAFMVAAVLLLVVFVAREVNRPLEKIVQGIIESMPDTCKNVFQGYYWDNLTTTTIADMFGFANANSVKTQKYKCLQKFRSKYNDLMNKIYG